MSASVVPGAAVAALVEEARGLLRAEGTAEQALLERLAASAIALGEAFTGTVFVARACEDVLRADRIWQALFAMPVSAIQGVTGLPVAGAPFVLPVEDYGYDIDGEGRGWVRVIDPGAAARVAVAYRAGLAATWDEVPAPLAQGAAVLVAHLFEDRSGARLPPAAVAALWRPWRRMSLGRMERRA